MEARALKPVDNSTSMLLSKHEFKIESNSALNSNHVVALGSNRLAVAFDKSSAYEICLMSDDIKPEKDMLYIRKKDSKLTYTVITPSGNIVRDILIDGIQVPNSLDIKSLAALKPTILAASAKNDHTHNPKIEIWEFNNDQKSVLTEFKAQSTVCSLAVAPSGQLYVGYKNSIAIWDINQKKQVETIDTHKLMSERLIPDEYNNNVIAKHKNSNMRFTPEGYLFITGSNSLVIIELKTNKCCSVFTSESFYNKNVTLPNPYIITSNKQESGVCAGDSEYTIVVWNKHTKKSVHAFECIDWTNVGGVNDRIREISTSNLLTIPNGKVLHLNNNVKELFSEFWSVAYEFQVLSLKQSSFTLFFDPYYQSIESRFPAGYLSHLACVFPGGKHFLCRTTGLGLEGEPQSIGQTLRLFDMTTKKYVHTLPGEFYGFCVMLNDGRVIAMNGEQGYILKYDSLDHSLSSVQQETADVKPAGLIKK